MKSIVTVRPTAVSFPAFMAERVYMREFTKDGGLPEDLKRWQGTVDAMLDGIDAPGSIYLMVDQKEVKAGETHRRGGVHIDGYWIAGTQKWDQPGPSWLYGSHGHGGHNPRPTGHQTGHHFAEGEWPAEAIVLASDVSGCVGYDGEFWGEIGEGGDCTHINLSKATEILMQPGVCYAGNVTMLHESIPLVENTKRTVVRLNVPGWTP